MPRTESGATLLETLVASGLLSFVLLGVSALLIQNAKVNQREQLRVEVQAKARNCIARVVKVLRNAGWDPGDHGIATVALDPDPTDPISQIETFSDQNGDGVTAGTAFEQVLIRHVGDRVEWSTDGLGNFEVLASNVTNDADGDGVSEAMFTPDSLTDPRRILVQVTAQASQPDPQTGEPIRYTLTDEVVLRKQL